VITKKYGVDFRGEANAASPALTLPRNEVTDTNADSGVHTKTHPDGWTITGELQEDYFVWVNNFEAYHPTLGKVWGNFEAEVNADSEEGFADFYSKHHPEAWDYCDI
jgi:hypothetical protein